MSRYKYKSFRSLADAFEDLITGFAEYHDDSMAETVTGNMLRKFKEVFQENDRDTTNIEELMKILEKYPESCYMVAYNMVKYIREAEFEEYDDEIVLPNTPNYESYSDLFEETKRLIEPKHNSIS